MPCKHIAPKAMAIEFRRAAAAASGRASMRLEAIGARSSKGYAGKIQMGVIVCIGNVLHIVRTFWEDGKGSLLSRPDY